MDRNRKWCAGYYIEGQQSLRGARVQSYYSTTGEQIVYIVVYVLDRELV